MTYTINGKQAAKVPSIAKDHNMATALMEPEPLDKLNWLIHLYHVRGEISKCKELIKWQINRSKGRHEYSFLKQGIILREEGKKQEALEAFQICHKLNSDNTDNIKEVAKCLFLLRKYSVSLEAYMEAERNASKPDWEIYYNIGRCLMCLGDVAKAKEYAKQAVQLGKQESAYFLLIKILIAEGDLQSAVAVCNNALEMCPDSTTMLTESGLLNLKIGQTQRAFQNLSSALALDPSCVQALLGVGCITQAHEDYDVALSKYKVAVQLNPDSVALWNNIGMCFYSKQKYVAAVSCLKRALWLSPLNWRVLLNLGLVHLSTLQPASAFNFLCAAVNIKSDLGLSFMALGCALFELKDVDNSLKAFRQAVLLTKDDLSVIANTAMALTIAGESEEAMEFLEKFKRLAEQDISVDKKILHLGIHLEAILSEGSSKDNGNSKTYGKEDERNDNLPQENITVTDANMDQRRTNKIHEDDIKTKSNVNSVEQETNNHFSNTLEDDEV